MHCELKESEPQGQRLLLICETGWGWGERRVALIVADRAGHRAVHPPARSRKPIPPILICFG